MMSLLAIRMEGGDRRAMLNVISPKRADTIIAKYDEWIRVVADRYAVPAAAIKAILYREMTQIDLMDVAADIAVGTGLGSKKDSSTGYAQIFGYVGLNAINFAVDRRLTTYKQLGIDCDHRLDSCNIKDVRLVWKKLRRDAKANIEVATLNLLAAAEELTGHYDFARLSDEELKLVFTRYNANVRHVTAYGKQVFALYEQFAE